MSHDSETEMYHNLYRQISYDLQGQTSHNCNLYLKTFTDLCTISMYSMDRRLMTFLEAPQSLRTDLLLPVRTDVPEIQHFFLKTSMDCLNTFLKVPQPLQTDLLRAPRTGKIRPLPLTTFMNKCPITVKSSCDPYDRSLMTSMDRSPTTSKDRCLTNFTDRVSQPLSLSQPLRTEYVPQPL